MLRKAEARLVPNDEKDEKSVQESSSIMGAIPTLPKSIQRRTKVRIVAPFILTHNLIRGLMHAISMGLNFLFMLAIMTYQGAFFISIVAGLGVGEFLFGRYASITGAH